MRNDEKRERGAHRARASIVCSVSLLRISPSLLSFSLSLLSISPLPSLSLSLSLSLHVRLSIFPLRTFIPAISHHRHAAAGPFFESVQFLSLVFTCMQLRNFHSPDPRDGFLSLFRHLRGAKTKTNRGEKREREKRTVARNQRSERRQVKCSAEWEGARLLEEGRNWGDDPLGERNPETPRGSRARSFLRRRCAFCPQWRTQRVSAPVLLCPSQLLLRPCSTRLPSPLDPTDASPRATLSFSLVYPPSLFSPTPTLREIRRRGETLPGRWSPVGFFFSWFVDRSADTRHHCSICNFVLYISTWENF